MFKLLGNQAFLINTSGCIRRSFFADSKCLLQSAEKQNQNKSSLYQLRKSTGFAMSKCREALEKHNGNIEEATKWLEDQAQKEGWTKAEKLKNRDTKQGTLVLYADKSKHMATIVELNCETDFVAKNEKFLHMSSQVAISVLENTTPTCPKHIINKDELSKIAFADNNGRTIGDQIALTIGSLGENISVRRAVIFQVQPDHYLSWYMHGSLSDPVNLCHFGKFGALVNLSFSKKNENYQPFDIGRQIAQHIVGMKPSSIGSPESADTTPSDKPVIFDDNETRLLYQEFLMKPNSRVLDFLNENNATIHDYVRFERGEQIEN